MTELETLTFFIQANHDDDLLYHYSRVVSFSFNLQSHALAKNARGLWSSSSCTSEIIDDFDVVHMQWLKMQGDKVKPADVLKPYEAVDRLKRAYVQVNGIA